MTTVEIPQSLIDEVRRRGVDIVEVLANILSLDPPTTSKAHLELAIKYLGEGRDLIDKDPIQSSEKLYKAAEESIKAIATVLNLDESRRAREAGRWSSTLLFDAVYNASERLGRADLRLLWG